ncbi:hypothetical protein EV424DRAFT_1573455 [Suillus variegatus]|nr:hypothetical protein EV424DRAFT_1573455 [Suillus variegatus]
MGNVSPEYTNRRRFKSLNGFYFAVATFLVVATFLSNVPNISLGFSFTSFSAQCQSTVNASFHVWKWYIQGPIPTLPAVQMSCALRPDGQLKDAKDIKWYNDPDDDSPMLPSPPPATSNGKITAFVSRRSGRAIKPTEKIRDAVNSAPAKRPAPAAPEGQPAPKRIQTGSHLNRHVQALQQRRAREPINSVQPGCTWSRDLLVSEDSMNSHSSEVAKPCHPVSVPWYYYMTHHLKYK